MSLLLILEIVLILTPRLLINYLSKAKFLLGWRPQYDLEKLIDAAWEYERAEDDPRKIWYPG